MYAMKVKKLFSDKTLALCTLGAAAFLVGSGLRMARHVRKGQAITHNPPLNKDNAPKVALMAPCKDLDPDFKENMSMLLKQDYPNYEVFFITVNQEDETYPVLMQLAAEAQIPAQVILGGFSKKRCQKLDNILAGIDALDDSFEVYAWVDSDARVPQDWLRNLIAPLEDPAVGASTSFRWYRPEKGRPITYLLALWTGIQFSHLHIDSAVSVWGGTMAIRKDNFEALEMRKTWDTALSDDCVLNDSVRKAGQQVAFVVPCMTSQSSDLALKDILIFAVRQCVIGKHTLKPIWWTSVLGMSFLHFVGGRGLWLLGKSLIQHKPIPAAALGMLSFFPAGILQNLAVVDAIKSIANTRSAEDPMHAEYAWALFTPAAYVFVWLTLLASATTDRFVWRKIYYRMLNSHETEVYQYPQSLDTELLEEASSRRT